MGHRSDCYGRGTALEGDKTNTGAECIASMSNDTEHGRRVVRVGDKTTPCPKCGEVGVIVSGEPRDTNNGKIAAVMVQSCAVPALQGLTGLLRQQDNGLAEARILLLQPLRHWLLNVRPQKKKELNNWLKSVTAIGYSPNLAFGVKVVMMPE